MSATNPYSSYVVSASAGCGKTHQLSQRFLHLVAAGARPDSILTVTFTRKAAAEMKARILEDAANLQRGGEAADTFAKVQTDYFRTAKSPYPLPPPLSPSACGEAIIKASGRLRISTSDSLFYDWLAKFPWEAHLHEFGGFGPASELRIMDETEKPSLIAKSWQLLSRTFANVERGQEILAQWQKLTGKRHGFRSLQARLEELRRHGESVWHFGRQGLAAVSRHQLRHDLLEEEELVSQLLATIYDCAVAHGPEKLAMLEVARAAQQFEELRRQGIVTQKNTLSSRFLSKKKLRDEHASSLATSEALLSQYIDTQLLTRLNEESDILETCYELFENYYQTLKHQHGLLEFSDLVRGCYRLFHEERGLGARFLIHHKIKHMLLDEFQDTSGLQWQVFVELARELLSGEGLEGKTAGGGVTPDGVIPGSVFIVGDPKQSIYGFRGATSTIFDEALRDLGAHGEDSSVQKISLDHSFRTTALLCDFVNETFADLHLNPFPQHATAAFAGKPVVPDFGSVVVLGEASGTRKLEAAASEAMGVARCLARLLDEGSAWPVYDKEQKIVRPLQPSDIAILYRSKAHAALLEKHLHESHIPVIREEKEGFFERQEIRDLMALVRFLAYPADQLSLAAILRSPMLDVSETLFLQCLAVVASEKPRAKSKALLDALPNEYAPFAKLLLKASAEVGRANLATAIDRFLVTSGALNRYAALPVSKIESEMTLGNIHRFIDLLSHFAERGKLSPVELVSLLESYENADLWGNAPVGGGAVTMMTIHKAKGLEFPLVMVTDTARPWWSKEDKYWLSLPGRGVFYVGTKTQCPVHDAAFNELRAKERLAAREEEERVLYVAMTRARHYLFVSGHVSSTASSRPAKRDKGSLTHFHGHLAEVLRKCGAEETSYFDSDLIKVPAWWWRRSSTAELSTPQARVGHTAAEIVLALNDSMRSPSEFANKSPELKILRPSQVDPCESATSDTQLKDLIFSASESSLLQSDSKLLFGNLVHLLLETSLKGQQVTKSRLWQKAGGKDEVDERLYASARAVAERTLESEDFRSLIAGASLKSEIAISYVDKGTLLSGQIDLLAVSDDEVIVIDFKTRELPEAALQEATKLAALRLLGWYDQVESYAAAVQAIYPEKIVTRAIVLASQGKVVSWT